MSTQLDRGPAGTAGVRARPAHRAVIRLGQAWQRHGVLLAVVATAATHLLFVSRWLGDDEGGFAMVARFWAEPGTYLYGPMWVDRPPGLIAVFAAANELGPFGPRLVAGAVATVAVVAAADGATSLAGRSAGRWAAWAAFAFYSSAFLDAEKLNGELVASTAVLVSVALLLRADRSRGARAPAWALALAAGFAAGSAVLVKQSFVDGVVFGVVLLTLRLRRESPPRRGAVTIAVFATGTCAALGVGVAWAASRGMLGDLVYAVGGFRLDASAVLSSWSPTVRMQRLVGLGLLAVVTGLALLQARTATSTWRVLRRPSPVGWAVGATAAVELAGVVAGGSYWSHYLIGMLPMTVLAAGVVAGSGERWTRRLVVVAVLVTVVSTPVGAVAAHVEPPDARVGRWIAASARPGDSITVLYTHANTAQASGLAPAYPYAWSLPLRTLDPRLDLLRMTLEGPRGPTWVVQWDPLQSWGLDADHGVEKALSSHYVHVADVCGQPVLLRRGVHRDLAPPDLSACPSPNSLP